MDDRTDIFRPEAIQHRERLDAGGGILELGPRWTRWAFWILLALVAAGLVAAATVHVRRYARGPTAVDNEGRVVVLIPAALAPDVAEGRPVDLGASSATVVSAGDRVLYPPEVKRSYGIDVAVPSLAVVTSASSGEESAGSARVLIESEPLIVAFVPGLHRLFGGGDG